MFICDLCGPRNENQYMQYTCEHEHNFCCNDFPHCTLEEIQEWKRNVALAYFSKKKGEEEKEIFLLLSLNKYDQYDIDELFMDYELREDVPESYCPVCKTNIYEIHYDLYYYLCQYYEKEYGITRDKTLKEFKERFPTMKDFEHYKRKI